MIIEWDKWKVEMVSEVENGRMKQGGLESGRMVGQICLTLCVWIKFRISSPCQDTTKWWSSSSLNLLFSFHHLILYSKAKVAWRQKTPSLYLSFRNYLRDPLWNNRATESQETWFQVPVSSALTSKSAYLHFPFCKMRDMEVGGLASPKTDLYLRLQCYIPCNPI